MLALMSQTAPIKVELFSKPDIKTETKTRDRTAACQQTISPVDFFPVLLNIRSFVRYWGFECELFPECNSRKNVTFHTL